MWAELCSLFPSGRSSGCSCPHSVSACKLTDEACFILYEFWQDAASWRRSGTFLCVVGGQELLRALGGSGKGFSWYSGGPHQPVLLPWPLVSQD